SFELCYTTLMSEPDGNLAKELEEQLQNDLYTFVKKAGEAAQERQQRLYLVGGAVRDIFLERCNLDIDLVVEGDAPALGKEIAKTLDASLLEHERFGTATLRWKNRTADIVTARAETYARPGALPTVRPGTLSDDLKRRDFTINAMAVELNPPHFGELIDPHHGLEDLNKGLIRILHNKSFIDDATRIWRAVRYEQRLDFDLEPATLTLLRQGLNYLDTISGDRIRHELGHVLDEEYPEKFFKRAGALGILGKISPSLRGDTWLVEMFESAEEKCMGDRPHPGMQLALLFYRLPHDELKKVITFLNFSKVITHLLIDSSAIKAKETALSDPGLAPSQVYNLLNGYNLLALEANALAMMSETAAEHIELYMNVLRHVNPALSGDDLFKLGVKAGPKVKEILQKLREARLDGQVTTKKQEENLVRELALKSTQK
ncbi:MAG TPA: CCA tRNA nucleotidyltransferase, partial [Dehalococcoidales bacterium]|nr:CCA tRNA nucleotidyltransferase [Dehalococcoidales bacterium]